MSTSERDEATTMSSAQRMLLAFLREHDADCPVCGYNLRALTRPTCPECGHDLVLTVGTKRLGLGWLFAAVAPGMFSGVAAIVTLLATYGQYRGDGGLSPRVITLMALDAFGWCSALVAIVLVVKFKRFIAQPRARQRGWALGIWAVHILATGVFALLGNRYF